MPHLKTTGCKQQFTIISRKLRRNRINPRLSLLAIFLDFSFNKPIGENYLVG